VKRVVPRDSMRPASDALVRWPKSARSLPRCSAIAMLTVSPRFFFGSSATLTPPNSKRRVRLSMLSCEGSNASEVPVNCFGLKSFITSATAGVAGISARCGLSSGRKMPTVRLSRR
jgi:hypothetical protein